MGFQYFCEFQECLYNWSLYFKNQFGLKLFDDMSSYSYWKPEFFVLLFLFFFFFLGNRIQTMIIHPIVQIRNHTTTYYYIWRWEITIWLHKFVFFFLSFFLSKFDMSFNFIAIQLLGMLCYIPIFMNESPPRVNYQLIKH